MGFSKKTAKGRLDKYYFLAKDQGYRARSAFKLVQLNKKYALLEQARVAVDLCAAPGGWLQVAAKYMPAGRVIVGVDLVPIRPIDDVSTIVADITTERCRTELKKVLKGWKADVVLHDGAPNVGKSWVHDAYSQAELVLHSMRLATELLVRNGSFVTKVFRSKDYNALMWVFNQLFDRVEATKPASSRDVSAEIFVVCRGYRAPERIDPRLLDPRSVFADVAPARAGDGARVNIEHPEKATRHRTGYEDGVTMLYKEAPIQAFIESSDFSALLATHNRLVFPPDTDARIVSLADAANKKDDIRALCSDLKVLGFREFKILTKWRLRARVALGIDASKSAVTEDVVTTEALELPEDPLDELDDMARRAKRSDKKERTKALERKAKQRIRMQADMGHATDLAQDALVSDRLFSLTSNAVAGDSDDSDAHAVSALPSGSDDDSDYHKMLDTQFEEFHALRKGRELMRRDLEEHVRAEHADAEDRVVSDSESSPDREIEAPESQSDAEALPDFKGLRNTLQTGDERRRETESKIAMWYANPLFRELDMATSAGVKRVTDMGVAALESSTKKLAKMKKASAPKAAPAPAADEIELVPAERRSFSDNESSDDTETDSAEDSELSADESPLRSDEIPETTKKAVFTPEGMTLAARLTRDSKRTLKDMVDDSFNRRSVGDDEADLPRWFLDDETEHNKPHKQVTKEGIALLRAKQAEIDARPIKKVLEARGRNRRRAEKKIDALRQRAAAIVDAEDIGERQKAEQIQRMMSKGLRPQRKEKKLVVARGVNRGLKGRPKGVKGHYKMVDSRMKKDLRAQKKARGGKSRHR